MAGEEGKGQRVTINAPERHPTIAAWLRSVPADLADEAGALVNDPHGWIAENICRELLKVLDSRLATKTAMGILQDFIDSGDLPSRVTANKIGKQSLATLRFPEYIRVVHWPSVELWWKSHLQPRSAPPEGGPPAIDPDLRLLLRLMALVKESPGRKKADYLAMLKREFCAATKVSLDGAWRQLTSGAGFQHLRRAGRPSKKKSST